MRHIANLWQTALEGKHAGPCYGPPGGKVAGDHGPRTHRKNKSSKVPWKHLALGWLGKVSRSKRQRPQSRREILAARAAGLLVYWAIGRETSPDCLRMGDGAVQAAGGLRKMR